eukprot:scaffold370552_cov19-Prasinocladus_malaysianus.AAC.1
MFGTSLLENDTVKARHHIYALKVIGRCRCGPEHKEKLNCYECARRDLMPELRYAQATIPFKSFHFIPTILR